MEGKPGRRFCTSTPSTAVRTWTSIRTIRTLFTRPCGGSTASRGGSSREVRRPEYFGQPMEGGHGASSPPDSRRISGGLACGWRRAIRTSSTWSPNRTTVRYSAPTIAASIGMQLMTTIDAGRTWRRIANGIHGDYHTVWVDPKNPNRIWIGEDGGIAVSYDRGENWEAVLNIPLGQFYQIHADSRSPFYYIQGGLQDNGTWSGPSRTHGGGIVNGDWRNISGGDGFHVINHPDHPEIFLSESQGGGIVRTDWRTRGQQDVSPQPKRNDGGPVNDLKYRFNWNAPIVASPHDKNAAYFGSN